MDEVAARDTFDAALAAHAPGFETFFLARLLQLGFSYGEENCVVRFPVADFLFNPQGSLHGGVIATVLDISMGHLLKKHHGQGGTTLELKIQYLRPITEGICRCEAKFLKKGRSVAFMQSCLYDAQDRPAALATATWMLRS